MTDEKLRRVLEANLAAGDIAEAQTARIQALIAAADRRAGAADRRAAARPAA